VVWQVRSGAKFKLWEDKWLINCQLKGRYPRIYNNSLIKDEPIVRFGRLSTKGWEWAFRWRREWFKWEKPLVDKFMTSISQVSLHRDKEDLWLWNDPPSYTFSVKSAYKMLANHGTGVVSSLLAYLWNLKVMRSTQFYVWRVFSNRIATKQNL